MHYHSNTYNNVNYRQRSQTLQPIRSAALAELSNSKQFIMKKYFEQMAKLAEPERANYANVPIEHDDNSSSIIHLHPPPPPSASFHQELHHSDHLQHQQHHQQHNQLQHNSHKFMHQQHNNQLQSPNLLSIHFHRTPPSLHNQQHSHQQKQHQQQNQQRHSLHARSQSQHYYQPNTLQVTDFNNYYNISNIGTTVIPARSRHPSPLTGVVDHQSLPPPTMHVQHPAQINDLILMQVCNELGTNLDSAPPMPSPRNYTISPSRNCGLYKIAFPHRRYVKGQYTDLITGISLAPGTSVSVLHPSKEDRSKFTVCLNDHHIDMPHQLTHAPQPTTPNWNY